MKFDLETTTNEKIFDEIIEKYNIKETGYSNEYDRHYEVSLNTLEELVSLSIDLGSKIIIIPSAIANKNSKMTDKDAVIEIYDAYRE